MQTFLPYPSYVDSAKVLDNRRLGKQRVECVQLLQALLGQKAVELPDGNWGLIPFKTKGWVNHPAAKMWRGYTHSLADYGIAICEEWISRGYKDTCLPRMSVLAPPLNEDRTHVQPPWIGSVAFHASHRSNLIRKDPKWYGKPQGWEEPDNLPYVWPVE